MNWTEFKQKWKKFTAYLNSNGVPLPMVRDPKTGKGSVSLTMTVISFNMVLLGLIGKLSEALKGIDLNQAMYLFVTCAALYWGRKFQKNDDGVTLGDPDASQSKDKKE